MRIRYKKDTPKAHGKRIIKAGTFGYVSNDYGKELILKGIADNADIEPVYFVKKGKDEEE